MNQCSDFNHYFICEHLQGFPMQYVFSGGVVDASQQSPHLKRGGGASKIPAKFKYIQVFRRLTAPRSMTRSQDERLMSTVVCHFQKLQTSPSRPNKECAASVLCGLTWASKVFFSCFSLAVFTCLSLTSSRRPQKKKQNSLSFPYS